MLTYKILLKGTGGVQLRLEGTFRKAVARQFGFFTTRFIAAPSHEVAADRAKELVTREAEPWTLPANPWQIRVEAVEKHDREMRHQGRGFTFFPEQ